LVIGIISIIYNDFKRSQDLKTGYAKKILTQLKKENDPLGFSWGIYRTACINMLQSAWALHKKLVLWVSGQALDEFDHLKTIFKDPLTGQIFILGYFSFYISSRFLSLNFLKCNYFQDIKSPKSLTRKKGLQTYFLIPLHVSILIF
jgi:hypothetical protein